MRARMVALPFVSGGADGGGKLNPYESLASLALDKLDLCWRSFMSGRALSLLLLNPVTSSHLLPAPVQNSPRAEAAAEAAAALYPEHYISVPVDHFHNDSRYEPHSNDRFNLRYWFDATYYKQGGPVIVLNGGETSGSGRLPYLQHGIVSELASATGGIGVILEHRYYGKSFPTADLSTKNYRFLTTDQSVADQAYFAKNVVFPGLEHLNLTAPGTPYIAYGGSYAGAFVAFLRVLYPDATWAAISSSGVTEAYYDFWQYYEPVRQYGPPACIDKHTKLINIADKILQSTNTTAKKELKAVFGMQGVTYDDDFANQIGYGVGYWQSRNWDPAINDDTFEVYCSNITSNKIDKPYIKSKSSTLSQLITNAGYKPSEFLTPMSNWITWFNSTILSSCTSSDQNSCFGYHDAKASRYTDRSLANYDALSWPYQYCTEWGFLQSGSTVPKDRLPLISRLVSVEWNMLICKYSFGITKPSNTAIINKLGGYNIAYPRLAIIGGQADPWRTVSPLADKTLENSSSNTDRLIKAGGDPKNGNNVGTVSEPLIVIPGAVHHWDENGVFPNQTTASFPPAEIKKAKKQLVDATLSWMAQWVTYCKGEGKKICKYQYKGPTGGGYGYGGYGGGGGY